MNSAMGGYSEAPRKPKEGQFGQLQQTHQPCGFGGRNEYATGDRDKRMVHYMQAKEKQRMLSQTVLCEKTRSGDDRRSKET